jgi:uncharacterized protein (DUF1778 family)
MTLQRNAKLTIRCTPEEYRRIAENAKALGMDTSNFVRMMCLNATPEVKIKGPAK